ncbi:unnamed protein product [Lasius platythorax]|uniref:Uncharacterized protein n=1 Tax=Lasius platythorax TaxID=488582 RepID=A0AAV2N346_9HYME
MEEPLRHSIPKTPAPARGWRFAKELIAWASYLRRHRHKDTCVYLCASAPLRGGSKSFTFLLHWLESRCFEPASFHSSLFIANHRSFYYSPYKNNKRNVIFSHRNNVQH